MARRVIQGRRASLLPSVSANRDSLTLCHDFTSSPSWTDPATQLDGSVQLRLHPLTSNEGIRPLTHRVRSARNLYSYRFGREKEIVWAWTAHSDSRRELRNGLQSTCENAAERVVSTKGQSLRSAWVWPPEFPGGTPVATTAHFCGQSESILSNRLGARPMSATEKTFSMPASL